MVEASAAVVGPMETGKKYRVYMVAAIVNISAFALGTTLGWTSPVEPILKSADRSPLPEVPTTDEFAWIGSLVALSALFAPFAAGPMADRFGRKLTLMISSIFYLLSYILLVTAHNVPQIYVARIIQGFGVGFVMTAQSMYIGEIASDDCRGAVGSFMQLFIVAGILYVYVIGPYVSYYLLQYLCGIIPIIFAVGFYFMPESPYYFVAKNKTSDAIESLKFLRGKSEDGVKDELEFIQKSVEEAMKNKGTMADIIKSKGNRKAVIISSGLLAFQQLSGINVILFYNQTIFEKTGSSLEPAVATILVGVVEVIASGATPFIVDRLGRKIILIASSSVMCVSITCMGLYFYLDFIQHPSLDSIGWLPIASLIIFVSFYCVGFGPLPWAVMGEMFPANIKGIGSSIATSTCWIFGFLVTRFFSSLSDGLGIYWAFWIFGILCGFAFLFSVFVVIETKGMSLQDIQDKLNA